MVVPLVAFTQEAFSGDVHVFFLGFTQGFVRYNPYRTIHGTGGLDLQFKPYQNEANVGFFWYGMV